jgi:tetratricopeptide (TPR) repeat protein
MMMVAMLTALLLAGAARPALAAVCEDCEDGDGGGGGSPTVDALERLPAEVRPGGVRALSPAVGARTWLALCLARMGDYPDAILWAEAAEKFARATAGPQEQVWADYALARIHLGRGHFDRGVPLLEEAFRLSEGGRFPIYFPRVLSSLGVAYSQTDRSAEALPLLERAVAEAEAIKLLYGHAMVLTQLGDFYLQAERLDDAQAMAARALDLTRRHGERGDEAWALHLLAGIAAARRPLGVDSATSGFGAAMALAEELGMRPLQARCQLGLGALYHRAGDPRRARTHLARATELFSAMEMLPWLRDVEALKASVARS